MRLRAGSKRPFRRGTFGQPPKLRTTASSRLPGAPVWASGGWKAATLVLTRHRRRVCASCPAPPSSLPTARLPASGSAGHAGGHVGGLQLWRLWSSAGRGALEEQTPLTAVDDAQRADGDGAGVRHVDEAGRAHQHRGPHARVGVRERDVEERLRCEQPATTFGGKGRVSGPGHGNLASGVSNCPTLVVPHARDVVTADGLGEPTLKARADHELTRAQALLHARAGDAPPPSLLHLRKHHGPGQCLLRQLQRLLLGPRTHLQLELAGVKARRRGVCVRDCFGCHLVACGSILTIVALRCSVCESLRGSLLALRSLISERSGAAGGPRCSSDNEPPTTRVRPI